MKYYLLLIATVYSLGISSQQVSHITAKRVYDDIVSAIGNTNPRAPKLIIVNSESNPAQYYPTQKTINLENKVLEICYSFGIDSLNALSYILSHELGHHYRNHGWMNDFANINFSTTTLEKNRDLSEEQHVKYEIEADIYAAFYSHISGYNALSVADKLLDKIYLEYKLPDDLPGYPKLVERIEIINKNRLDFTNLRTIFDIANITMSLGQYDYAQELYKYIIEKGFTSREIYNNLGLCYVYEALDLDVEDAYFNLLIPFKIDLSTRLESNGSTRGAISEHQQATMLFNDAKREFETAIRLDNNYYIARENLFFTDVALTYLGENVRSQIISNDLIEDSQSCEFCVKGHSAVVNKELNKAKKLFKKGSSSCAICEINTDFRKKQTPKTKEYKKSVFDLEEVNGIDMYCKDFKSKDCDIYEKLISFTVGVKEFPNLKLIQLKRKIKGMTSCISIQEISTNDDLLINSVNIYVNDDIDKILDKYKELRIINSANKKYISIVDKQLTFLIEDEKVSKWYYFERLD